MRKVIADRLCDDAKELSEFLSEQAETWLLDTIYVLDTEGNVLNRARLVRETLSDDSTVLNVILYADPS